MLIINRKSLIDALRFLAPIFTQKSNKFESLKGVLISLTVEAMRITSCDLETTVTLLIPVSWEGEVKLADAVLNGKALLALLRSLAGEGLRVEGIPGDRPGIRIIDETGSTAEVPGVCDPEVFPGHPSADFERVAMINSADLTRLMIQGGVSMGENTRFSIHGVKLIANPSGVEVVSVDGCRLSVAHAMADVLTPKDLMIASPAVELLSALPGDVTIEIDASSEYVRFRSPGREVTSKLMKSAFPDYEPLLAHEYQTHVTVDRAALADALRRTTGTRNKRPYSVWTLDSEHGDLTVAGESEAGKVVSHVPVKVSGPGLTIGVQQVQVLEYLAATTTQQVEIELDNPSGQFRIFDQASQVVAMPVRI